MTVAISRYALPTANECADLGEAVKTGMGAKILAGMGGVIVGSVALTLFTGDWLLPAELFPVVFGGAALVVAACYLSGVRLDLGLASFALLLGAFAMMLIVGIAAGRLADIAGAPAWIRYVAFIPMTGYYMGMVSTVLAAVIVLRHGSPRRSSGIVLPS